MRVSILESSFLGKPEKLTMKKPTGIESAIKNSRNSQQSYPLLGLRSGLSVRRSSRPFSYTIRYGWRMGVSCHLYLSVRMMGGSGTKPIRTDGFSRMGCSSYLYPSTTDDGWGVSLDPSVSVIRRRIGPMCRNCNSLLWIDNERADDKTYKWVSMWWKTKN